MIAQSAASSRAAPPPASAPDLAPPLDEGTGRLPWKVVYTIIDRGKGRRVWLRVGIAFPNRDQSLNVRLDAVPISGQLHIRDAPPPGSRDHEPLLHLQGAEAPAPTTRATRPLIRQPEGETR